MNRIYEFDGEFAWLSNFYESPIQDEAGWWYPTVEHYFQAAKTLDINEFEGIVRAETPSRAKRLGRRVTLRPDWENVKIAVMKKGLYYKFTQHEDLKEKLLATGDVYLEEGNSWHDNTWGNCSCPKCVNTYGKNLLGELLMDLREYLRS